MAYPPTPPPNTRANNTPMVDNHPGDHDLLANNITDLVAELGPKPAGPDGLTLTSRLGWLTYKDDLTGWVATVPAVGSQAGFTFKNGATTLLTLSPTGFTSTLPWLSNFTLNGDLLMPGEGVGHRIMLGTTSPWQVFKGADTLLHVNVDGSDFLTVGAGGKLTFANAATIDPVAGGFLTINSSALTVLSAAGQQHLIHSGPSGSAGADLFVQNNSVRIAGTTAAETWSDRPLVVTTKGGAGQCGIGFGNLASGLYGQLYTYGLPTLAFDFRDGNNTTWLPVRASAFSVSSSGETKNVLRDLGPVLAKIARLRPVVYERGGMTDVGLLAEEAALHVPEVVQPDADGNPALLSVAALAVLALAGVAELVERLGSVDE